MMYFDTAFAASGTKTTIPGAIQPSGAVSFTEGWGIKYETDPGAGGYDVPRDQTNELYYQITLALKQYQEHGVPDYFTAIGSGGAGYAKYATVLYSAVAYMSLVAANTATPGTDPAKWIALDGWLPLTGGILTGDLYINKASPLIRMRDPSATGNFLISQASNSNVTLNNQSAAGSFIIATNNGSGGTITIYASGDTALSGSLGITTAPAANLVLDIVSTTKAAALPRMTTTQKNAIASPSAGMIVYDTTLGEYQVYTSAWGSVGSQLSAPYQNLNAAWASNTTLTITADAAIVYNSTFQSRIIRTISTTINCATTGANGLDAGSLANNTWYYGYLIYNPTTATIAALASTSATAPTLPSGYTFATKACTAFRTGGSATIIGFKQVGSQYQYVVGSNLTSARIITSGASGSPTTPTWTAVSISNFVPTAIAGYIHLSLSSSSGSQNSGVAPNNSYGVYNSVTNAPPILTTVSSAGNCFGSLLLETTDIYYYSGGSEPVLYCPGFQINL